MKWVEILYKNPTFKIEIMNGYQKHAIWQEALDKVVLYQHSYLFVADVLAIKIKSDPNIKEISINANEIKRMYM